MTLLTPTRRNLLGGLVGLIAAPAVVHAANLIPISVWKEIRWASTEGVPEGWIHCDGGLARISDYPELFADIGNAYGGDGITTFAVPQLHAMPRRLFDEEIKQIINARSPTNIIGITVPYLAPKPADESGGFYGANNAEAKEIGARYTQWEADWENSHPRTFQYPPEMERYYIGLKK